VGEGAVDAPCGYSRPPARECEQRILSSSARPPDASVGVRFGFSGLLDAIVSARLDGQTAVLLSAAQAGLYGTGCWRRRFPGPGGVHAPDHGWLKMFNRAGDKTLCWV